MSRLFPLWLCLGALACGSREPVPAESPSFGAERPTQLKRYHVALRFEPDPPPMGELFQVVATVTAPDGTPVEDAKVTIDARMPQHAHGMETDPVVEAGACDAAGSCRHPGGEYRASGFKFHMGGDWTLLVDVSGPRGIDSTSFVYPMGGG